MKIKHLFELFQSVCLNITKTVFIYFKFKIVTVKVTSERESRVIKYRKKL